MPIATALAAIVAGMAKIKTAVIVLAIATGIIFVGTVENSKEIEKLKHPVPTQDQYKEIPMTENAQAPVFVKQDPRACGDEPAAVGGGDPGTDIPAGGGDSGAGTGDELVIPEKFLVKGESGDVDHKGSLRKALDSYTFLEKKLGSGDVPPATAEEYKLEKYLPEGYDENPEAMKPIMGEFHKLGLSQRQVQGVLNVFGSTLSTGLAQEKQNFETAQATLKREWGRDYERNVALADRTLALLVNEEERKVLAQPKYGADPVIMKLLAAMGKELSDDRLPSDLTTGEIDDVEQLRTSEAYRDTKHPDHKRVVAKVNEAYQRGYKAK